MTQPVTGQRPHRELISELYDRHASGLFVYCYDQLGDPGSAADALVAVLTGAPPVEPSRAALYTLARREINRRDVRYPPPATDTDPATALVERVIREIRPHQREVLLLSAVCRLSTEEIAAVLDVALDTASELIFTARHRFAQSLAASLEQAHVAGAVPPHVAEVLGALEIAPIEDSLARFPWRQPPLGLRARLLAVLPTDDRTPSAPPRPPALPIKQLWPTTPNWPVPLAEPDEITQSGVFTATAPPRPRKPINLKPEHDATTEPMPQLHKGTGGASGLLPTPGDPPKAIADQRRPRSHQRLRPFKAIDHHYDWMWELVGLVICVAIALTVFFAVPMIITP
ncbi:MAG TPA: sigma-70 family RNA polymerase sigma factor [Thermopolyspora sp.]